MLIFFFKVLHQGRRTALSREEEAELANCITIMCRYGFSPTITNVREIIYDYLESNIKTLACFKDGRPGKDWFKAFMKRNNLSMKHAEMMCAARKKATENPFIIYEFYEMIYRIIKGKNLTVKQIWNTDESGFPVDLSKCKMITKQGETAYKVTLGPGREKFLY